jgi:hypothetical protein
LSHAIFSSLGQIIFGPPAKSTIENEVRWWIFC